MASPSMGSHSKGLILWVVTIVLCCALDRDWKLEEEMQGWGVEEGRLARLSTARGSAGRDKRMVSEVINRAMSHVSFPA